MRKFCTLLTLFLAMNGLAAQGENDPAFLIGMNLKELVSALGLPESVKAVRGDEAWQDDVVFVYPEGDFYILKDRVWQLGINAVYGIRTGDKAETLKLVLGDAAEYAEDYLLYRLPTRSWPMEMRINLDGSRMVSAIFIYRSDL